MKNQKLNAVIVLDLKPSWVVAKGHQSRMSGAGHHGDRRMKRLRTRSAQRRAALGD